jgi:uncharacterized protein (DUF2147 family)
VCGLTSAALASGEENELFGTWRNPRNSVHVQLVHCGQAMCGVVVWASEKAKADARASGTDPLIGINLLRDFVRTPDGKWRGKVFVPDLRKTVSGTVTVVDSQSFQARSCALGFVCRTQVWTRVS